MQALRDNLNRLIGEECCLAVGGRGNGSMVTIHLGKKIVRNALSIQEGEPPEQLKKAKFKGEYCIFIKGCSWRLEQSGRIFCTWREAESDIALRIKKLENLRVVGVTILGAANDLCVQFEQDLKLTLFCDQSSGVDAMENYAIKFPGVWFSFGPDNRIAQESASP
jgi:hypothetical protein